MQISSTSHEDDNNNNITQSIDNKEFDQENLYINFVAVKGQGYMTPSNVSGYFDNVRSRVFDLPLEQKPIIKESDFALQPDKLTETEKMYLDEMLYDLDDPQQDKRIRSKNEYYEYTLLAIRTNINTLLSAKRKIAEEYSEIAMRYNKIYSAALEKYGASMGKNDSMRNSWMFKHFPALTEIKEMYENFLEEFGIEQSRLEAYQQTTSRALAAYQDEARTLNATGAYKYSAVIKQ